MTFISVPTIWDVWLFVVLLIIALNLDEIEKKLNKRKKVK